MKIGDLIRVRHFGSGYNGMIGVLMSIRKMVGFKDTYSVRIPNLTYEIGLSREQCEVLT
tara:strand:- start:162 stop:338 length:177 start_codon:yes stop_codon:yes gene_type:complete